MTSGARLNFIISLDAALNVFALSESKREGKPLLPTNLRKAQRNDETLKVGVSSRCTPLVDAHVNNNMYTLSLDKLSVPCLRINRGPTKSSPVLTNGGASDTRSGGRSGDGGVGNGTPSALRHTTHFLRTCLTACRPRSTQKRSQVVVRVSLIPLCFTRAWVSRIMRSTNGCFGGSSIGCLLSESRVECSILPLHLIN